MAIEYVHIKIDKELKKQMQEYAKSKGISLSGLIRMAVIEKMKDVK